MLADRNAGRRFIELRRQHDRGLLRPAFEAVTTMLDRAGVLGAMMSLADGRLPSRYRAASLVTAVVLVAIGWLLLLRGGVIGSASENSALTAACWAFAGLFALNTLGNLAGRHPLERWGMGALTACLTVLCVLLALG